MHTHIKYIVAFVALPLIGIAQKNSDKDKDLTVSQYIDEFKDIAIQEMERSGIPASITLAQGIHESSFGNSELAKKSNNHFGIKCTKDWDGGKTYKWDDEEQKSCFRVYKSADHSYVDHTDFLLNRKHYAFLFEYDRKDYKKWAKGLRKAGYATDPKYPDKLIATIEKHDLAKFDKSTGVLTYNTTENPDIKNLPIYASTGKLRTKPRSFFFKSYKPGLFHTNTVPHAISRKGESALAVAKRFDIPYKHFLKFNDLKDGDKLMDYQPAYIYPKKSTYRGEETFYKVDLDKTMYEIAQHFGIKLSSLLAKNLMVEGEEPQNGEMIMLKEKAVTKPKLRPKNHIDTLPPMYIEEEDKTKKNTNTSTWKSSSKPVTYVVPTVERPKPQTLELNTPTYSKEVYADTAHINTSKSKDKAFLDIVVSPGAGTVKSTVVDPNDSSNPFSSHRNSLPTPAPDPKPAGGRTEDNRSSNDSSNPFRSSTNSNSSNPFSSPSRDQPTDEVKDENPGTKTTDISSPRVYDNATYGGTKTTGNSNADLNNGSSNPFGAPAKQDPPKVDIPTNTNTGIGGTNNTANVNTKSRNHVVQKGETLWALYRIYKVKPDVIKAANNLTSDVISTGQQLRIPMQ